MKNETKKEAKLQKSRKAIQTRRKQNSWQEPASSNHARRLSPIKEIFGYSEAFEKSGRSIPKDNIFDVLGIEVIVK